MLKILIFNLLLVALAPSASAEGKSERLRPRIVYLSPSSEGNTYWQHAFEIMKATAKSLDFVFEHYDFGVDNRFLMALEASKILEAEHPPDAVVAAVAFGAAVPILEIAERNNIPVIIQGPLFADELSLLGGAPRQKFKNWIANFEQDEVQKGYLSAKTLIQAAINKSLVDEDGKIHMVAIGGRKNWIGSVQRDLGLEKALAEFPQVELHQSVAVNWSPAKAEQIAKRLLERHPKARIIWAASDQMAFGASKAVESLGGKLGSTHLVSAIDLSKLGLESVQSGRTVVSTSMSMLGFADMAIYLYDYLHGHDFTNEIGTLISPQVYAADSVTAQLHQKLYDNVDKINFKQFSKVYNAQHQGYQMGVEAYLKTVKP